jgi:hypothetical protein
MLTSVLSPIQIAQPDPAPPWGWNPAATFLTAYRATQEERRAQEEFAMQAELNKILFPVKKAQAEFNLKELAYASESLAGQYKLMGEARDAQRRMLRSGSGSNAAGSGVGGTGQQAPQTPTRSYFNTQPVSSAPSSNQNSSGMTLGSGITP